MVSTWVVTLVECKFIQLYKARSLSSPPRVFGKQRIAFIRSLGEVNRQSRRYRTANQIFIASGTGQSKETANQIVASQTNSLH